MIWGVTYLLVSHLCWSNNWTWRYRNFINWLSWGDRLGSFPGPGSAWRAQASSACWKGSVKWLQMQTFPKNRGEQDNPCRIVWWNPKNELIALRFSPAELIFALQCTMVPWHPPRPHNMQEFDNGINWTNVFRGLVQEPYVFSLCDNESRFHRTPFLSLHPTQHASCPDFCTDSFYHRIGQRSAAWRECVWKWDVLPKWQFQLWQKNMVKQWSWGHHKFSEKPKECLCSARLELPPDISHLLGWSWASNDLHPPGKMTGEIWGCPANLHKKGDEED